MPHPKADIFDKCPTLGTKKKKKSPPPPLSLTGNQGPLCIQKSVLWVGKFHAPRSRNWTD